MNPLDFTGHHKQVLIVYGELIVSPLGEPFGQLISWGLVCRRLFFSASIVYRLIPAAGQCRALIKVATSFNAAGVQNKLSINFRQIGGLSCESDLKVKCFKGLFYPR